ncbi:MAG: DUF2141 domain-containing protein [Alteraurantiacibacter sp.]
MQNRSWAGKTLTLLIGATAAVALGTPTDHLLARTTGAQVSVQITNLRNHDGVVRACMTRDADRFPRCQGSAQGYSVVVPAGQAAILHFDGVAPGTYAIALLHDENDNGKADRVLGMMPREGFGFSNDAPVKMGPPAFSEAAITVGARSMRQTIQMRYML